MAEASVVAPPGPFEMPAPIQLDHTMRSKFLENYVNRLLQNPAYIRKSGSNTPSNRALAAQNTLGMTWDKDVWTATVTRLITRGIEHVQDDSVDSGVEGLTVADLFRERLFTYVTHNFRERLDFCTIWLNEEWYSATLHQDASSKSSIYNVLTNKVLDAMLPYLEAKDRIFMRFLSDLPELDISMIKKLRTLCVDPDRALLGYTTLQ